MSVCYDRLWELIYQKRINKSSLAERCGISRKTIVRMNKSEPVALDVIDRICIELDCKIEEVIEIKKE